MTEQDSMRDWPMPLRRSAALDDMARCIYFARSEYYGLGQMHWQGLSPEVRQGYREIAQTVFNAVKPDAPKPFDYAKLASEGHRTICPFPQKNGAAAYIGPEEA